MFKPVSIYILKDPDTELVRYVGKTVKPPAQRLSGHIYKAKIDDSYKDRWIRSLLSKGVRPTIEVIDEVQPENWQFWERHYIKLFKSIGARLTNAMNGGEDEMSFTDEIKKKISDAQEGRRTGRRVAPSPIITSSKKGGSPQSVIQLTKSGEFIKKFSSLTEAQKETGIALQTISACCRKYSHPTRKGGKPHLHKYAGGFMWKYGESKASLPICPECNGKNIIKGGTKNGKQRVRCKDCGYNYFTNYKTTV
jgi:hypothetical protein